MSVRIETQAEPIPGYRLLDRLGSGGFGEVWRAEAPGGIFKAIKIIHGDLRNRDGDAHRFAEQELKALKRVKQVRHPYLLALDRYDIVEGRLFITMELADCNLWDRFRQCRKQGLVGIPRDELLRYMSETAEVLDLFNDKFQLQHLDIKPQNLFLLYDHVKVADFGQVKDLEGLMAEVTGGITPVYAAPETFDGVVSRYCDQYSLACVYQELLTGQRPFDGTSMQQLLMQHLQLPPNLAPAPPCDRPALAVALAKKHDERFPSVGAFVRALMSGGDTPRPGGTTPAVLPAQPAAPSVMANSLTGFPATQPPGGAEVNTPAPRGLVETAPPPVRPAPPAETGPGCLRPALVVGLGYTGLRVLQRLRADVAARFGPAENTPTFRTLYVDTDPDALAAAADGGLSADDVFPARLHRPGHYLKPRIGGRTILDGWLDPQMLYKMPRTPVTLGYRSLGRLAAVDHYRALAPRLQADLEAALDPAAMAAADAATGLGLRTNRPRVYVVAGLGGGTGGGMLVDVAYAARSRLRRLGYADADVVGVLLVPPDAADVPAQAMANTYAALTELHHYARPDAVFTATYDERAGAVREADPPFNEVVFGAGLVVPPGGPGATPTNAPAWTRTPAGASGTAARPSDRVARSGTHRLAAGKSSGANLPPARPPSGVLPAHWADPATAAADYLRLHLFTPAGRALDDAQPARHPDAAWAARTFGAAGLTWPRAAVVARTGRVLAPVLVQHWVNPDPAQVRQVIPKWAQDQWAAAGLAPPALAYTLTQAAGAALGADLAGEVAAGVDRLAPKGWRARTPDPAAVAAVVDRWVDLLGRPNPPVGRAAPPAADAFAAAADAAFDRVRADHAALFPALVETPLFRLAGAEEAIRQVLALLDRACRGCDQLAADKSTEAAVALDLLLAHARHEKGVRKPTAAEFADAVRAFPDGQLAALAARASGRVYRKLKDVLVAMLSEVSAGRQRVGLCLPELAAAADRPAPPAGPGDLLPAGCATPEDAAQTFLASLTDDDLTDLDTVVQAGLDERFGGLYQASLNATDGTGPLLAVVRERTRMYLQDRLGEVDLAGMLFARSGGPAGAAAELNRLYDAAAPAVAGTGPWSRHQAAVYAGPAGQGGDPVRDLAAATLPTGVAFAPSPDEAAVVREYPDVPVAALPQLGPQWAAAYKAFADLNQATPHARLDVTKWADVDSA